MSFNSGGTTLSAQFNLKSKQPLDGRYIITTAEEYNSMKSIALYPGLTFAVVPADGASFIDDAGYTVTEGFYRVDLDGTTIIKLDNNVVSTFEDLINNPFSYESTVFLENYHVKCDYIDYGRWYDKANIPATISSDGFIWQEGQTYIVVVNGKLANGRLIKLEYEEVLSTPWCIEVKPEDFLAEPPSGIFDVSFVDMPTPDAIRLYVEQEDSNASHISVWPLLFAYDCLWDSDAPLIEFDLKLESLKMVSLDESLSYNIATKDFVREATTPNILSTDDIDNILSAIPFAETVQD